MLRFYLLAMKTSFANLKQRLGFIIELQEYSSLSHKKTKLSCKGINRICNGLCLKYVKIYMLSEISYSNNCKTYPRYKQLHQGHSEKTNFAPLLLVPAKRPNFVFSIYQCCFIFHLVEDSTWGTKSTKGYVPLQEADDGGVNLIVYFSKGENNKWAGERFHDGKIHIKSNIPNQIRIILKTHFLLFNVIFYLLQFSGFMLPSKLFLSLFHIPTNEINSIKQVNMKQM